MAEVLGLNQDSPYSFAPTASISQGTRPIDFLVPGSRQHTFVLDYLMKRLNHSVSKMSAFYPRWQAGELKLQAYVSVPDYTSALQDIRTKRRAPELTEITVPYSWATINTIVTYLLHMFGGRSPIFQTKTTKGESIQKAANMELLLQYNADYVKLIRALYFFLLDGETYGVSILRTMWRSDTKVREVLVPPSPELVSMLAPFGQTPQGTRQKQSYVSFEGNSVANVDPFMFFPDPRVPMYEVNEKGEYVFWRAFEGRHMLLREQAAGRLKWVDKAPATVGGRWSAGTDSAQSIRALRAFGSAHPGDGSGRDAGPGISSNFQVDQGSVEIIPAELGLGEGRVPEKWLFTILNESTIVQAQPLNLNHGKHPIVVAEPNSVGYSFGSLATSDMLGPLQDVQSWFLNSHIYNVRAALNNLLVVDPSKVEMQDLLRPKPGGVIRLKNTAFGQTRVEDAIKQLTIYDVTQGHVNDFQLMSRLASDLTGATDNVRGLQEAGGRKTATEVRTAADAGASRLAAKGKVYSAMAITGLAEQQSSNFQQFLSQEHEFQVLGAQGPAQTVRVGPDSINGEFYFPIHDGTLPIDKAGMFDLWQGLFGQVLGDPQLRQQFDVVSMFNFIAQLGGAQNLNSFKITPQAAPQIAQQVQVGNMIPAGDAQAGLAQAMSAMQ